MLASVMNTDDLVRMELSDVRVTPEGRTVRIELGFRDCSLHWPVTFFVPVSVFWKLLLLLTDAKKAMEHYR